MKEDVLVCPFCGQHSRSKLTTNISNDCVVKCNYCDNQFKMAQARTAPPEGFGQRTARKLHRRLTAKQSSAGVRLAAGSSKSALKQLDLDIDAEAEVTERNELAIAAFATALAAFPLAGCLSPISLVFAIVALERRPRGLAAAAMVLSLAGLVPMTVVALPWLTGALQESLSTQVVFSKAPAAKEETSEEQAPEIEAQAVSAESPVPDVESSDQSQVVDQPPPRPPVATPPPLQFSDIKQAHKPLGGIGIYLTAENASSQPVTRFEAVVQFIDTNQEVVVEGKIRESFYKPIAPGEKRSLLFTPGFQSDLARIVPKSCRGAVKLISVNGASAKNDSPIAVPVRMEKSAGAR